MIARVALLGLPLALATASIAMLSIAMLSIALPSFLVLSIATPTTASAQDDPASRARALFEEGIALSDRGAYEQAIERFRESNALVERPSTLFNLGVALRELRRDAEAIDAFERFLVIADASIDDAPIAQARSWIAATQRAMASRGGTLVLEYEPHGATVRVDGMEVGSSSPLVLDLAPGAHRVELASEGREPATLELDLAPGERVARRVELAMQRSADPGEPFRIAGWIAVGTAAVAFGGAIAATVAREDQVARYHSVECDPSAWGTRLDACPELRTEIEITTGLATTTWIAAGVFAAAGVTLVLLAPGRAEHAGVAWSCAPGFAEIGIACAARF